MSSILYRYLIYIRPFIRWTEEILGLETTQPSYLWLAQHTIDIEAVVEEGIGNDDDEEEEQPLDAKLLAA